ncbi:SGNH hydrolase-type esterase domain-containing protein [Crassisporium funariophilum]|nr:SGNH hydrolase-type esterase domain-containing protein [Crassisporium funariophilum]
MAANIQDVFMLFGDSITQGGWEPDLNGFGQRLSHVYARRLDVLNRGLSGYNTDWAIPVFEQVRAFILSTEPRASATREFKCIAKHTDTHAPKVRVLAIWFGANDACIQPSPQHVPLAKFKANLVHMVNMLKSPTSPHYSPTTRIILITPPPVDTYQRRADLEAREPPLALDRMFEVTRAYAKGVQEVGMAEGVPVVDVWTTLWIGADRNERELKKYLRDGLHLNAEGYRVMYDAMIATIAREYPEVHYDNLPYSFPAWAEINWENPAESLLLNKKE